MASFDFFTKPQLSQPPVSLFGDAAEQGVRIGNALPTELTSAIRGVQEGIGKGQQTIQNQQQIELNRQEIESYPTKVRLEEAKARGLELENQIRDIQLDINIATQEAQQKATLTKLQRDKQILDSQAVVESYMSGDEATRANILTDPKTQAALSNREYATSIYNRLAADSTDPIQRQQYLDRINALEAQRLRDAKAALMERERDKDRMNYETIWKEIDKEPNGEIKGIMVEKGLSRDALSDPSRVEIVPSGTYDTNADGTKKSNVKRPPMVDKPVTAFDVFVDGVKTTAPVDSKSRGLIQRAQESYMAANPHLRLRQQTQEAPPNLVTETKDEGFFEKAWDWAAQGAKSVAGKVSEGLFYEGAPTPEALQAPEGEAPVVTSSRQELLNKAARDPDYRTRMIAKGMIGTKEARVAEQIQNQEQSPVGTAVQIRPEDRTKINQMFGGRPSVPGVQGVPAVALMPGLINQGVQALKGAVKTMLTPKEEAATAYDNISEPAKKYVEKETVAKVHTEPLLKDANPLAKAVVAVESAGKRGAKSPTGPHGLFQLSKAAAKDMKVNREIPEQNVKGGIKYLNMLLSRYNGNEPAALMAYNVGMGVIDSILDVTGSAAYEDLVFGLNYLKSKGYYSDILTKEKIKEASQYPLKVAAYKEAFEALDRG